MKFVAKVGLALCLTAAFAYAENYSGKLIDSACHDKSQQQPTQEKGAAPSCDATAATTSFAVQTADGKVYKLDAAGNAKASTALRGNPDSKNATVAVSGTLDGQTLKVDTIDLAK